MPLISLTCPNCGAKLSGLSGDRDVYYCQYCGNKVLVDRGAVAYQATEQARNLAERGMTLLSDRKFDKAGECFELALKLCPNLPEGHMGLLLTKCRKTSEYDLKYSNVYLTVPSVNDYENINLVIPHLKHEEWDKENIILYDRALKNAAGDLRTRYEDINGLAHQAMLRKNETQIYHQLMVDAIEKKYQAQGLVATSKQSFAEGDVTKWTDMVETGKKSNKNSVLAFIFGGLVPFILFLVLGIICIENAKNVNSDVISGIADFLIGVGGIAFFVWLFTKLSGVGVASILCLLIGGILSTESENTEWLQNGLIIIGIILIVLAAIWLILNLIVMLTSVIKEKKNIKEGQNKLEEAEQLKAAGEASLAEAQDGYKQAMAAERERYDADLQAAMRRTKRKFSSDDESEEEE